MCHALLGIGGLVFIGMVVMVSFVYLNLLGYAVIDWLAAWLAAVL